MISMFSVVIVYPDTRFPSQSSLIYTPPRFDRILGTQSSPSVSNRLLINSG